MADIAQILAGLLGGVSNQFGDIIQQRRQNDLAEQQKQYQQGQLAQSQRELELKQLQNAYNSLDSEVDIDPTQAQKFTSAGYQLVKGPSGMARRPQTDEEKLAARRLKATDLEIEGKQGELSDSAKSRAFRESLQTEGGMQSFMSRPTAQKEAIWAAMGLSGKPPMTAEELAAIDLASSTGEQAVQRLQNQGYAATAQMRLQSPTADDVDPAKFQQWVTSLLATNPKFRQAWDLANQNGTRQAFEQDALNEFRRQFKNMQIR